MLDGNLDNPDIIEIIKLWFSVHFKSVLQLCTFDPYSHHTSHCGSPQNEVVTTPKSTKIERVRENCDVSID